MLKPVFAALMVLIADPSQVQHLTAPRGGPVMIDGRISAGEWRDASSLVLGRARIWVKQTSDFVCIAVEFPPDTHGFADLIISPVSGQIIDLHASAKLGERTLGKQGWSGWNWWNNDGWTANVSRVDSFEQRTFLPETAREYQIRRSRFPGKNWRMMVELSLEQKDGSYHAIALPANATEADPSGWIELTFSP